MRLGEILDRSSNEIYVFDAETLAFVHVNQGALRNLQYTLDEIHALSPLDIKSISREEFSALVAPLQRGELEQLVIEERHTRKDGTSYPVEVHLQLSRGEARPVCIAITIDISVRKAAEAALRQNEEARLSAAAESSLDAFFMLGAERDSKGEITDFRYTYVNMRGAKLLSRSRENIVGSRLSAMAPGRSSGNFFEKYVRVTETRRPLQEELSSTLSGTTATWLRYQVVPLGGGVAVTASDVTYRKQAELALQASEQRLRMIADNIPALIAYVDTEERYRFYNQTYEEWVSIGVMEMLGCTMREVLGDEPYEGVKSFIDAALAGERVSFERDIEKDGVRRYVQSTYVPHFSNAGQVLGFYMLVNDLTDHRQAEEALFKEKELAQVTLESIGDAVITTDARGSISYLNPVAERLTGWSQDEAFGLPLEQVFRVVDQASQEPLENPVAKVLRNGAPVQSAGHNLLLSRDGSKYSIEDSAAPIRTREGGDAGVVLVFHDVTRAREMADQISHQATHDALTDLLNRRGFEHASEALLHNAKISGTHHALLYIDLDQFKVVNDTSGHLAGDELLRQLASLLMSKMRRSDTLARLGGDEFGVLLEDCPLEQARRIAELLIEAIRDFRFTWGKKLFTVGASAGLVAITEHSESMKALLSAADTACFMAKDNGRNRVQLFTPDDAEIRHRHGEMDWLSRITAGLEENRFFLYYQGIVPISKTAHSRGEHYELLLRLQDENGNVVLPMAFIPAAERYNLMPEIDRWVIRTLFASHGAHYREMHRRAPGECLYAINLSGTSISDLHFLEFVIDQFESTGTPPQAICFEITETAAIANLNRANEFMLTLKQMGCHFSLDDFGSGLSSFGYLKNLPVDYIKIDGGFVKDIADDAVDHAMVEAIMRIARVMDIKTIAEFVENGRILAKLREIGVDYAQGFDVHVPEPLIDLSHALPRRSVASERA
ncbi:MAG: EAL domain-containing protein [Burkholderiales bacterium]|nr:EAL domain-containing protein [Burkholderiales bacterium]